MERWTRLGIEAYRTGNREQAQRFFHYALMEKPNDIRTWLWLVEVADNDAEKQRCLTRVLALDPNHVLARRALDEVEARITTKRSAAVDPFEQAVWEGGIPKQQNSAVEIRSTPPFIEELAQKNAEPISAQRGTAQVDKSRKRSWGVIALIVVGVLAALLLAAWAIAALQTGQVFGTGQAAVW